MRKLLIAFCFATCGLARGADLQTRLAPGDLDQAAFASWVDGAETPLRDKEKSPSWIVSTTSNNTGHSGLQFGDSKSPGRRHLRIPFTKEVPVGSVLTR